VVRNRRCGNTYLSHLQGLSWGKSTAGWNSVSAGWCSVVQAGVQVVHAGIVVVQAGVLVVHAGIVVVQAGVVVMLVSNLGRFICRYASGILSVFLSIYVCMRLERQYAQDGRLHLIPCSL
jgi:hypothetical protein